MNKVLRSVGGRVMNKQIERHSRTGGFLDVRFGLALLRDRRISVMSKLLALVLGGGLTALLLSMELPVESMIAVLLPFFGFLGDSLVDGMEMVMGPFVFGAMLLPLLADSDAVQQVRDERDGLVIVPR